MRALEFRAHLNPDGTLRVPREVADEIRADDPLRVILLLPDLAEAEEWSRLGAKQFLEGYADSDAIYDELPAG